MGVIKFDGPAGQVNDSSFGGFRRHPSQPSIDMNRSLSASGLESHSGTGINYRTSGNLVGAERRLSISPVRKASSREMLQTQSSASRKPRYTVRTITPQRQKGIEEPRPVAHHVPGSFRSEISVVTPENSGCATPVKELPIDAVTRSSLQPLRPSRSQPALTKDGKSGTAATIESKETTRPTRNPFFMPYSSRIATLEPAPLALSPPDDGYTTLEAGNHKEYPKNQSKTEQGEPKTASLKRPNMLDHIPQRSSSATYSKDDLSLIGLTTIDPVLSTPDSVSDVLVNQDEPVKVNDPLGQKPTTLYTSPAYGRKASLGNEPYEQSRTPVLEANNSKIVLENNPSSLLQGTEQSKESKSAVRETPLDVNQRSGLQSLADLDDSNRVPSTTWTKHDVVDFINEASRLRRSLSVSSSSNTGSTGDSSDMVRLVQGPHAAKHSYRFPTTAVSSSGVQTPSSRHHWVHHLLGRQYSPPSREAHLTQRPSTIDNGVLGKRHNILSAYHKLDTYNASNRFGTSETTDATSVPRRRRQADPETFSRVIFDLESLMREVLLIAKHVAAEKEVENIGPAVVVKTPTDANSSIGYSFDTAYNRRSSPISHAVSSTGVWATSDGNASLGPGSAQEQLPVSADRVDFVESAIASQERSNAKNNRDKTLFPSPLNVHPSVTPELEEEFQSVSAHARELARRLGLPDPSLDSPSKAQQQRDERRESVLVAKSLTAQGGLGAPSVIDFATKARRGSAYPEVIELSALPPKPLPSQQAAKEQRSFLLRGHSALVDNSLQNTINRGNAPQVQTRTNSVAIRPGSLPQDGDEFHNIDLGRASSSDGSALSFSGESTFQRHMTGQSGPPYQQPGSIGPGKLPAQDTITTLRSPRTTKSQDDDSSIRGSAQPRPNLKKMHHFSIRGPPGGFSLRHSHRRAPIARDWSDTRKRFVALVTCLNTALLGIIIGIYAGEVPAIQYAIADENHSTILGNVVFYLGLAIPTFFFWPLPLLHGRKPYTLAALAILMPLQFPQALVVGSFRSPDSPMYRVGLLLSRSFAGVAMGFANFNFQTTLLDLFGASLQSGNPHQEVVNENDVRRHGGGMGVWLGIWTWCSIGSLGVGFFIGAVIISGLNVAWGFWITIVLTAAVLLLNVVTPEVRRSPYRRSLAEVPQDSGDVSRRIARGEIMMHLYQTGPIHWWEEVRAGLVLVMRMLSQPAFVVMAVYLGWIYGQIVMIIVLLGALTSRYYRFHPQYVGLCVLALSIGALIAVPFQRGNIFSRARHHPPRTDSMTFQKRFTWTSHLVRRITFMLVLPFAGLAYTLSSGGPPTPFILPTLFAGGIGFLSNLAIAECYGIIMETFDTSDLQPGMTGRPRKVLSDDTRRKQTNFSSFPRVTAAFMICQTFSFIIAAAATGTGGRIERRLGAQASTGVVAGVLLILTAALTAVLIRIKTVQVVPVKRWGTAQLSGPGDDWKPVIVGHPSGINRRVSLLEQGAMTRWVEIRRRNRLLDEQDRRAETFGVTTGQDAGFGPGPGPGPSGVRDFGRAGNKGVQGGR